MANTHIKCAATATKSGAILSMDANLTCLYEDVLKYGFRVIQCTPYETGFVITLERPTTWGGILFRKTIRILDETY